MGGGNIQPSFAVKRDGTIVAYMRDNGPAPKHVHVSESKDRGETWKYTRHLEAREAGQGGFHYPSIIEGRDGKLHVSYSYFIDKPHGGEEKGKSIRYATFSREWIKNR